MRKPRHYWTSTKNQEIQILLTTLLSLWTLQDVPDGKSQQLEWTSLIPAGKAGLFAISVLPSALLNPPVLANSGIPSRQSSSKQAFRTQSTRWMAPGTSKLLNRSSSSGNLARQNNQCSGENEIRNYPTIRPCPPRVHWYFIGCQRKHPPHIRLGSMLHSRRMLLSSVS